MSISRFTWPLRHAVLLVAAIPFSALACSSTSDPAAPTTSAGAVTCSSPGAATPGPADTHCATSDGGLMVQSTSQAACNESGDAGGPGGCAYGPTLYGHEADDDDCKYHVVWTSTSICEGAAGVQVTVSATHLGTAMPVTGASIRPEVFTTSPPNEAGCDDMSSHESPSTFTTFTETTPGTYVGRVVFDEKGAWTMRFHLFESCYDVLPDSPHGHAAFHVTVP